MKVLRPIFAVTLFLLPIVVQAQDSIPPYTEIFPPEEFAARRANVMDAIGPDAIAIIQGAPSSRGYVRFRQSNQFYYLTGIEVPHAYLLLDGSSRNARLYLPYANEAREQSEGKILSASDADSIEDILGFDQVYGPDLLAEHLSRYARNRNLKTIYTPFSPAEGLSESRDLALRYIGDIATDPWDGRPSREGHFIHLLKMRFPVFDIKDLTPTLDALRLIKSDRELDSIRKATELSGLALMEVMRSSEPGIKEKELDAVAKFIYFRNGAQGDAYYSLVATGTNAYFPHYHAGRSTLRDGDLVLMDYAPDYRYYMSDLTRTWPVNGTFNTWQRELYGFYVSCYKAILAHIRPGVTASQIRQEAVADMKNILSGSSFTNPIHERAARAFDDSYDAGSNYAGSRLGHWVGMSTHDVGDDSGPLKPGMVFTIEPALRVPEERIYIRCEDLIIITEDGAEIVSDFVPLDIEDIERIMLEPGMLQQYPPSAFEITTSRH